MKIGLIIAAIVVLATLLAWLGGADPLTPGNWSGRASEAITPWRTSLMLCRWGFWGLLWWRWEPVGQWLFNVDEDAAAQRTQWSTMRHRMLGAIVVVEALILFNTITGG